MTEENHILKEILRSKLGVMIFFNIFVSMYTVLTVMKQLPLRSCAANSGRLEPKRKTSLISTTITGELKTSKLYIATDRVSYRTLAIMISTKSFISTESFHG